MTNLAGFELPADEELIARCRKFCGDGDRLVSLIVTSTGENTYYVLANFLRDHPHIDGHIAKERYLAIHDDGEDKLVTQENAGINLRISDMEAFAAAQRKAWTRYNAVCKYGDDGETLVLNLIDGDGEA